MQKISIRPAAVAGSFYPKNPAELDELLNNFLIQASNKDILPKAIVAPHAGYIYSGPVAAEAYATLGALRSSINRVLLLGPAHREYVKGVALPSHTHFSTPLGNIALDCETLHKLNKLPFATVNDSAHAQEHSLETQLPFLQKTLDDFLLIPVLVGESNPEDVALLIESICQQDNVLLVVSSDLSHFHDYAKAKKIDAETTRHIELRQYDRIGPKQACGCMPLNGLLKYATDKNLSVETVLTCNSGDTAGSKEQVVGYGSYAVINKRILNAEQQTQVFSVIRNSIKHGLTNQQFKPELTNYSAPLTDVYAIFITLKINGKLRGCIGTTEAREPLINAIAHFSHAAAFSDPRFSPVTREEYEQLEISLSLLTPASPIEFSDEQDLISQLRPGTDGLIIEKENKRATFLPIVWESLPEKERFLSELKKKAGITNQATPDNVWRYTAEYYS